MRCVPLGGRCLQGLEKHEQGHSARWRLASYRGEHAFDVYLHLDRNPDEPCLKLQFHSPGSKRDDLGHVPLAQFDCYLR